MKPASALILIGLLLLGLAGVIYYMHNAKLAEGSSNFNRDSPPTSTQTITATVTVTETESSITTSKSLTTSTTSRVPTDSPEVLGGVFTAGLTDSEGRVLASGSGALSAYRFFGNDNTTGKVVEGVEGKVVVDVGGRLPITYSITVVAYVTPVGTKNVQPVSLVPVSGGYKAVIAEKDGTLNSGGTIVWVYSEGIPALLSTLPDGEYKLTFYAAVSLTNAYGSTIKYSGPVSFVVESHNNVMSWVS